MKKVSLLFVLLLLALALTLTACNNAPKGNETADVIEVIDGYLVVNGVKTEYKVHTDPVISVIDGYVAVNGIKTEYLASQCDHVWKTVTTAPTCSAGGYDTMSCKLCGKEVTTNETAKLEHTFNTTYSFDENYHWFGCIGCSETNGKEMHTPDDADNCTVCGIPLSATPGVVYDISAGGTYALVIGYEGTATKVKIASEYQGLPVKNIYDKAFSGNETITTVIIPDSVTSIGEFAFLYCFALTSIIIPDTVTRIRAGAFDGCNSALYTEYNYCKYVGDSSNPYKVLVGVTNQNLSTYEINENTRIIADSAFYGCSRLTSITIPDYVTRIGDYAFFSCTLLKSVILGDSVIGIGQGAFQTTSLSSIDIPNSVTSIDRHAFACTNLKTITFNGTVAEWDKIEFGSSWNSAIPANEVVCSDGTVKLY